MGLSHMGTKAAGGVTHQDTLSPTRTSTRKTNSVASGTASYQPDKHSSVPRLCSTDATALDDIKYGELQIHRENTAGPRPFCSSDGTSDRPLVSETSTVSDQKLSEACHTLQRSLLRVLQSDPPDYHGVQEIVQHTRNLYALTIYHMPEHTFHPDFEEMGRALDYWAALVTKLNERTNIHSLDAASTGCMQALLTQSTFENRLLALKTRKELRLWHKNKLQIWKDGDTLDLDIWTLDLALLFEGLLGTAFMPCAFEELVGLLETFNHALCGVFDIRRG